MLQLLGYRAASWKWSRAITCDELRNALCERALNKHVSGWVRKSPAIHQAIYYCCLHLGNGVVSLCSFVMTLLLKTKINNCTFPLREFSFCLLQHDVIVDNCWYVWHTGSCEVDKCDVWLRHTGSTFINNNSNDQTKNQATPMHWFTLIDVSLISLLLLRSGCGGGSMSHMCCVGGSEFSLLAGSRKCLFAGSDGFFAGVLFDCLVEHFSLCSIGNFEVFVTSEPRDLVRHLLLSAIEPACILGVWPRHFLFVFVITDQLRLFIDRPFFVLGSKSMCAVSKPIALAAPQRKIWHAHIWRTHATVSTHILTHNSTMVPWLAHKCTSTYKLTSFFAAAAARAAMVQARLGLSRPSAYVWLQVSTDWDFIVRVLCAYLREAGITHMRAKRLRGSRLRL